MKSAAKEFGILAGLVVITSTLVQVFLFSLDAVIEFHQKNPLLVWALPLAWVFFLVPGLLRRGIEFHSTDQVLREVSRPERRISPWQFPAIWSQTLWSHLFGASVGREGAVLQLGSACADTVTSRLNFSPEKRQLFLRALLAAALASTFRAPWAALIFGLELNSQFSRREAFLTLLASWLGFAVAIFLPLNATPFWPQIDFQWSFVLDPRFLAMSAALAALSPLYRLTFATFNQGVRKLRPWQKWPLGGLAGLLLFLAWQEEGLRNLGLPLIENSFLIEQDSLVFLKKLVLTAVFNAFGWFGGDFTPLMSIGASAGQWAAIKMGFAIPALGAAIGLFLMVGFTHSLMFTAWVLTLELFGWQVALASVPAYVLSYLVSRRLKSF